MSKANFKNQRLFEKQEQKPQSGNFLACGFCFLKIKIF